MIGTNKNAYAPSEPPKVRLEYVPNVYPQPASLYMHWDTEPAAKSEKEGSSEGSAAEGSAEGSEDEPKFRPDYKGNWAFRDKPESSEDLDYWNWRAVSEEEGRLWVQQQMDRLRRDGWYHKIDIVFLEVMIEDPHDKYVVDDICVDISQRLQALKDNKYVDKTLFDIIAKINDINEQLTKYL